MPSSSSSPASSPRCVKRGKEQENAYQTWSQFVTQVCLAPLGALRQSRPWLQPARLWHSVLSICMLCEQHTLAFFSLSNFSASSASSRFLACTVSNGARNARPGTARNEDHASSQKWLAPSWLVGQRAVVCILGRSCYTPSCGHLGHVCCLSPWLASYAAHQPVLKRLICGPSKPLYIF
jgi:hypothetical protein